MTALTHKIFGEINAEFIPGSKFFGKECTLDDINRQDVMLTKTVGWWEIRATEEGWARSSTLCTAQHTHPPRPPSSPLTNLQAALEALKES